MKIIKDLNAFSDNKLSKVVVTIITNPNFHALILFRVANFMYRTKLLIFIAKFLWYINRIVFNIDIDYRTSIGGGFVIKHGIGVVIGKNVVIGENCVVYQNVTLGGNSGKSRKNGSESFTQPKIGDNTTIFAGAKVVGPIIVGENCIIGVNAIITKDIEMMTVAYNKNELMYKEIAS